MSPKIKITQRLRDERDKDDELFAIRMQKRKKKKSQTICRNRQTIESDVIKQFLCCVTSCNLKGNLIIIKMLYCEIKQITNMAWKTAE